MSRGWAFIAAAFIIIVPMYQEVKAIFKQTARNREDKEREDQPYREESQPLKQKEDLSSRLHSQLYLTPLHTNKQGESVYSMAFKDSTQEHLTLILLSLYSFIFHFSEF